jgi:hypothetical protein
VAAHVDEERVLRALLINFEKHRLPRVLDIKEKVDRGEVLNDWEVAFLEGAITEAMRAKASVDRHPKFQAVYARAVRLYDEVTVQALKNEQRSNQHTSER